MNPFRSLGLQRDASESEVKRAYAKKLKTTRPDDDPQGFQRLNDAYQRALELCRQREMATALDDEPEDDEEIVENHLAETAPEPILHVARETNPAPEAAQHQAPPFDFEQFLRELEQQAHRGSAQQLGQWLHQREDLYDLQLKHAVGDALHDALRDDALESINSSAYLQALADFFGFDLDPWLLERRAAVWAIVHEKTAPYGVNSPRVVRQLKRAFSWQRALFYSLWAPSESIVRLGNQLHHGYHGWPPQLDYAQYEFFARLNDPTYAGKWRWTTIFVRTLVYASIPGGFMLFAGMLDGQPARALQDARTFALIFGIGVLLVQLGLWAMSWLKTRAPFKNKLEKGLRYWWLVFILVRVLIEALRHHN